MSLHLQRAVEILKKKVLTLSTLVEENVGRAVRSVEERDAHLARKVIETDVEIDHMEIEVEEEALKTLALHQPVAVDLRFIVAVLKLNGDLERIGDLAVNIAERTVFLAKLPPIHDVNFNFARMFEFARQMLKQSLDSMIKMDTALAYNVCSSDDELDAMNREMYGQVKTQVQRKPDTVDTMLHYLSISRCLERIGDHATNIAEDVIYMTDARIIRHKTEDMKA